MPKALSLALSGLLIGVCVLFFESGCSRVSSSYLTGSFNQSRELRELFGLLENEKEIGENRFIFIQQISNLMLKEGQSEKLILFLTTYVEKNPLDPYNAYYLRVVAESYKTLGAVPLAIHYYERILMNYPDLLVSESSIHYRCLQELLALVQNPKHKIEYYKELISRFSDWIDLGATYYFLARTYEEVGEWEKAIQAYQQFLQYPEIEIPGMPNTQFLVRQKVDFFYSSKEWAVENLTFLVGEIKQAINNRDAYRLLKYKAKVNFFTVSWSQQKEDEVVGTVFDISAFLRTSHVITDDDLDIDSNSREAYLRTTRWSYWIPTWYLYFRKVDFKPDPEINGRWEWAGIFFGEKL